MTRFAPGARVRVRDDWPETRGPAHIRTPYYVRGMQGEVVRVLGTFANPEDLAFNRPAPVRALYHVRFAQPAIWDTPPLPSGRAPDGRAPDGRAGDEVLIELFEHWLEPA